MTIINGDFKKITNLDYLTGLSKGNTQFIREMIDTFLIENPKEIEVLEKAIKYKKIEAIKQAAHLLQSSIPFVGLDKIIGNEVYEIEKIATDKLTNQKNKIQMADNLTLEKIEILFYKVKEACGNARHELSKSEYQEQSA